MLYGYWGRFAEGTIREKKIGKDVGNGYFTYTLNISLSKIAITNFYLLAVVIHNKTNSRKDLLVFPMCKEVTKKDGMKKSKEKKESTNFSWRNLWSGDNFFVNSF